MSQERTNSERNNLAGRLAAPRSISLAIAVGLAFISLVLGATLGFGIAISQSQDTAAELTRVKEDLDTLARAHETLQERNWVLYLEAERLRSTRESGAAIAGPGVFTDGTYKVGPDIEPGTYRGEVLGEFGYWARLRSTTGMLSAIITNDIVRGPFVLTINPADAAVELRGVTLRAQK